MTALIFTLACILATVLLLRRPKTGSLVIPLTPRLRFPDYRQPSRLHCDLRAPRQEIIDHTHDADFDDCV